MGRDGALHEWQVISDPADLFQYRIFRLRDLKQSAFDQVWPNGILFRNLRTGEELQFRQGQLAPAERSTINAAYSV
jgi:hypothetical protein